MNLKELAIAMEKDRTVVDIGAGSPQLSWYHEAQLMNLQWLQ